MKTRSPAVRRSVLHAAAARPLPESESAFFEPLHAAYAGLCAALYNFAPLSGHPGGSLSSGRIAEALLFESMDYDFTRPGAPGADLLVYAAGHKALGLYALWALRNELVRIGAPERLPDVGLQLRLEDLLGFRKNPSQATPLTRALGA
ncbi:MAG: hypothetical protein HY925_08790, partial [Elusimicrobia bacterium]|nr:hypothetical protein [Elusimicrobiota bacterium]